MSSTDERIRSRLKAKNRNVLAGMLFLLIGGVLLMRQLGFIFPDWLFSWHILLIVFGFFIAARNNFHDFGGFLMMTIGAIFLIDDIWPTIRVQTFIWPLLIIGIGLIIIFSPSRFRRRRSNSPSVIDEAPLVENSAHGFVEKTHEEVLDIVAVFGSVKKMVLSKNFRGGDIVSIFGGAELNLAQADFTTPIVLDIVAIFGGTKLIIPANWEIHSEMTAIFGGIEDKRMQKNVVSDKVFILKGTCLFGGIEVNSF